MRRDAVVEQPAQLVGAGAHVRRARPTRRAARGGGARPRPRARSRSTSGRGTACARTRSGPRNASNTRPARHGGRHRQVAAGEALAEHEQVGPQRRTAPTRTACRCARSRWRPRRRSAARRARGTRRRARARPSGSASCMPAAPCTSGSTITAASSDACAATIAIAVSKQRGVARTRARAAPGSAADRTGRCRSRRRRPRARRCVSPWYAPPNARNACAPGDAAVRPVLERDLQRLLDRGGAVGREEEVRVVDGHDARQRLGQLDDDAVAVAEHGRVRAAVELRRARASSSSGTWWPSVLTHSDEMASR